MISVIKVSDDLDKTEVKTKKAYVDKDEPVSEAVQVAENLTLSISQFEMILSDLKTRHLAEKRML